jgi:hypothetical protein
VPQLCNNFESMGEGIGEHAEREDNNHGDKQTVREHRVVGHERAMIEEFPEKSKERDRNPSGTAHGNDHGRWAVLGVGRLRRRGHAGLLRWRFGDAGPACAEVRRRHSKYAADHEECEEAARQHDAPMRVAFVGIYGRLNERTGGN